MSLDPKLSAMTDYYNVMKIKRIDTNYIRHAF